MAFILLKSSSNRGIGPLIFYRKMCLIPLLVGVGYKNLISGNPRSKSSNCREFCSDRFGTNIKAIGQKLIWNSLFSYHGVWSLPATGNWASNYCLCSSFYNFKDILILFVAIPMYFRSGKTLSMFVFTLGYNLSQQFGKMYFFKA